MIKENKETLNAVNCITDMIIFMASAVAAYFIVRLLPTQNDFSSFGLLKYIYISAGLCPVLVLAYYFVGLYDNLLRIGSFREFLRIFFVNLVLTGAMIGLLFLFGAKNFLHYACNTIVLHFAIVVVLAYVKRLWLKFKIYARLKKGKGVSSVLLVGSDDAVINYYNKSLETTMYGIKVNGYISNCELNIPVKKYGGISELEKVLATGEFNKVVAALNLDELRHFTGIVALCEKYGIRFSFIPYGSEELSESLCVDDFVGMKVLNIRRVPLDNVFCAFIKRSVDVILSVIAIIVLSPVMLIAAIGVKLSSPGPIIFKQERVGYQNKTFMMYKFRSMRINDRETTAWSTNVDSRKTLWGSIIRKLSIDELPQFFNVLKGDMSIVGPRPEIPKFVDEFKETIPRYMVKHHVRPGITGWAQVSGFRGDTSIEERIKHDIYYIENWTFWFDIKILFLTVFTGLVNSEKINKGAKSDSNNSVNTNIN